MDAGADMIFPDGLMSVEELERCVKEIPAPIHYNMSKQGVSFYVPMAHLEKMGVAIVSNPGGLLRTVIKAMWDYAQGFAVGGTEFMMQTDSQFDAHPTGDLHAFVGFPEIRRLEEEFLPREEVDIKYRKSLGYRP